MIRSALILFFVGAFAFQSCANTEGQEKTGKTAAKSAAVKPAGDDNNNVEKGGTEKITKADFLAKIMDYEANPKEWNFKGDKPCIVDFYADWCGPCKMTSPILEELSKEYAGKVDFYKVDTDDQRELASVFGIQSIPTFLFCPVEGKPTMASGIARTKEETKQMFIDRINSILLKKDQGQKKL
ncbi:MAG TPA: thioredoxin [Bacteroidales bacterium]|nr:thioredoxin [Bacteroidales bacterium]